MSATNFQLALVQQKHSAKREDNLARIERAVAQAAAQKSQLVVLSELHNSLYFCQVEDARNFDLAESIPGPTTERLAHLANTHNVVIVASLFERRHAGLYHNTAVVFDTDGSIAGCYRKMHIPDDPGYYEKYYFTPGDLGFTPIQTSVGKLGILVCWDQWYPEAARLMALAGAQLLIYPTAIGWEPNDPESEKQRQYDAWKTMQRSHAIANGLPVIACNRQGREKSPDGTGAIDFWGGSFITDGFGGILAQAPHDQDQVLVTSVDMAETERLRRTWPFLRDRRIDAYGDLLKRFRD